ncbi:MAG TPA: tRNA glutamyl-Q(34) synthetase GluQRS [Gammaproteobacteria bacterium]|nr:tRNA glutamyl-Q(34) synthetase GluQRS [Gammaproteobacteria bacterium]
MPTTGRFAPTPSGPLHFGSLVAALASYCQARATGGHWLMRIEDVDTPRVVDGAESQILLALEAFGFEWDGPVLRQSGRFEIYRQYIDRLIAEGACFACECSRRSLREQGVNSGPLGQIYPGNCRDKGLPQAGRALRLNTAGSGRIEFRDGVYGNFAMELEPEAGDFVLRRGDGIYAYHLAVVVDDEEQGVDEIVRGADLLENTCLHIYLQRRLGFATPSYLHIPLINNVQGVKLSKQTGAAAIDAANAPQLLVAALSHLAQQPDPDLLSAGPREILAWAVAHWSPASIPAQPATSAEIFDS